MHQEYDCDSQNFSSVNSVIKFTEEKSIDEIDYNNNINFMQSTINEDKLGRISQAIPENFDNNLPQIGFGNSSPQKF